MALFFSEQKGHTLCKMISYLIRPWMLGVLVSHSIFPCTSTKIIWCLIKWCIMKFSLLLFFMAFKFRLLAHCNKSVVITFSIQVWKIKSTCPLCHFLLSLEFSCNECNKTEEGWLLLSPVSETDSCAWLSAN